MPPGASPTQRRIQIFRGRGIKAGKGKFRFQETCRVSMIENVTFDVSEGGIRLDAAEHKHLKCAAVFPAQNRKQQMLRLDRCHALGPGFLSGFAKHPPRLGAEALAQREGAAASAPLRGDLLLQP